MTRGAPGRAGPLSAAAAAALAVALLLPPALALAPGLPGVGDGLWLQAQRILPADASAPACFDNPSTAFAKFGFSMDTDGDLLAVGARGCNQEFPGAVYLFERLDGEWRQRAKLDGRDYERRGFGYDVALDGDVLVVGAPFARTGDVIDHGAAFVFERSGDDWVLAARLADPGVPESWDYFGKAVAVSGDTVAVGAPQDDPPAGTNAGSVFLYTRSDGGWELVDHFTGTSRSDVLGKALALDGGTLLVGAPNGRYVHSYEFTGGAWGIVDELLPASPPQTFGYELGLDGDVAIVGAAYDRRIAGQELPCVSLGVAYTCAIGSAYIFERGEEGWALVAELENPRHAPMETFGYSVAVGGDVAVVGAPLAHPQGAGAAYVYERLPDGWALTSALRGDDTTPGITTPGDWFGWAVGVSGRTVLASAILDDNRGDGSPPPLDDLADVPPCVVEPLIWGCDDGEAAGTVYAFEKLALRGVPSG